MSPENRSNEDEPPRPYGDIVLDLADADARLAMVHGGAAVYRLAADVPSLLARLAAVERERDSLREDVKIRDAEITRQYGIILALDNDADQALTGRDEAIEAESQAGDRIAAERDAAVAENARLLARIAAIEALHFTHGRNILGKPVCAECSPLQPMPCPTLRALAASSTPTAAEKYAPCRDCGHDSADHRNDEPRPCKKRCRCVSFESPLPGQEKP